jgi:hypothetical protein
MASIPKYKKMTTASRMGAFIYLNRSVKDGVLERGAVADAARMFSVHNSTMTRFWREINTKLEDENYKVEDIITNLLFFENNRKQRGRLPIETSPN